MRPGKVECEENFILFPGRIFCSRLLFAYFFISDDQSLGRMLRLDPQTLVH